MAKKKKNVDADKPAKQDKPKRDLPKNDILNHPKFNKFKGEGK